jgi:hypothetical protein
MIEIGFLAVFANQVVKLVFSQTPLPAKNMFVSTRPAFHDGDIELAVAIDAPDFMKFVVVEDLEVILVEPAAVWALDSNSRSCHWAARIHCTSPRQVDRTGARSALLARKAPHIAAVWNVRCCYQEDDRTVPMSSISVVTFVRQCKCLIFTEFWGVFRKVRKLIRGMAPILDRFQVQA